MSSAAAIIFDVDGVLLELTAAEEDAFFWAFEKLHRLTGLSRDWDSYRIRNDEDIINEILITHLGRSPTQAEHKAVIDTYLAHLTQGIGARRLTPVQIDGASQLLASLNGKAMLGVATANLIEAAGARLAACGLWEPLKVHAFGANGGGAKLDILARALQRLALPPERVVFIGDNLNDVAAGLGNGVHFIGFSVDEDKCRRLAAAGAQRICNHHRDTLKHIEDALQI